jgi:uncharacterized membrane-anchored protein
MKKDSIAIAVTSATLFVYAVVTAIDGVYLPIIVFLFIALHILLIWMVLSILKQPTEVKHTFEERFYQDKDFPS